MRPQQVPALTLAVPSGFYDIFQENTSTQTLHLLRVLSCKVRPTPSMKHLFSMFFT